MEKIKDGDSETRRSDLETRLRAPFSAVYRRIANPPKVVSVLKLNGIISVGGRFSRSLDDASLAPLIKKATKPSRLAAIAVRINSPGGSPVQSKMIAQRLRDAADERAVPLLAFCEDVAASGGYMIACAADEIFADPGSIVGSIGVMSSSFGFHDLIARWGVERRLTTAGINKARLDPFEPVQEVDQSWLSALLIQLHEQFIGYVKERRGEKISPESADDVFSGDAFLAQKGRELGLVDGFERMVPLLKERFGDDVRMLPISKKAGFFSRLGSGGETAPISAIAAGLGSELIGEIEERAHWARFGM